MPSVEDALCSAGIYRDVQALYQRTLNRTYWKSRQARRRLLETFVRPGDLVFDVGANVGTYVPILLDTGARVVAIEPIPALADLIRRRYRVAVETAAVGTADGEAVLHLGRRTSHSTTSQRWMLRAPTEERWTGDTIAVPLMTLETLMKRHGIPAFVKIDVEGSEADVLRGSSQPLRSLSFEFQASAPEVFAECVFVLAEWGDYHVAFANAGEHRLHRCANLDDLVTRLNNIGAEDPRRYGDVYAWVT